MSKQKRPQPFAAPAPHSHARTQPRPGVRASGPAREAPAGRATPAPPAAYRPQPLPKVLQTKSAVPRQDVNRTPHPPASTPVRPLHAARAANVAAPSVRPKPDGQRPAARPAHLQRNAQAVAQPKLLAGPRAASAKHGTANPPAAPRGVVQRTRATSVVQATKLYPNLHPGAVERVETDSVFKLSNFADQYRLRKTQSHGVYVPNQLYNFVRTSEGDMLLHNRYRHPSIAEGRQVLYAGEVYFNNGKLEWWSNGSGHYQPDSEDAQQAALPMDNFYSYQQVIKGEHKQKRAARG